MAVPLHCPLLSSPLRQPIGPCSLEHCHFPYLVQLPKCMQELIERKVTFNQSQGFPVLLNLKVNRCLCRFLYSKRVGHMHQANRKDWRMRQLCRPFSYLSDSLTIQPILTFIRLDPLGCPHHFCDRLRASQCRADFFFEHDKHLIIIFQFCMLSPGPQKKWGR